MNSRDFLLGFLSGAIMGASVMYINMKSNHETNHDQACHVVHHSDSDGFKYWSCEKNK